MKGSPSDDDLQRWLQDEWCYETGMLGEFRLIHRNFGLYAVQRVIRWAEELRKQGAGYPPR